MQPVIYDVAVSIDGYIAGPSDDVSNFPHQGPVVDDYLQRLETYSCCLMGRRTYEFGYGFGLKPGQNPYPGMRSMVFSSTIQMPDDADVELVSGDVVAVIDQLRQTARGPIYLCGGGEFAGALAEMGLIHKLRLKRAPFVAGCGVRLFGGAGQSPGLAHVYSRNYANGVLYQEYDVDACRR